MGISPSPMGLFDVTVERIDDVPVIKIFVASGSEKPYYKNKYGLSEKGCFIRVGSAAERGAASSLLSLLSNEFTTADLIKLRARKGQSVRGESIRKLLQRWRNNGRIEKVSENTWRQVTK